MSRLVVRLRVIILFYCHMEMENGSVIILLLFFFNCPWYSVPKGEEIKQIV